MYDTVAGEEGTAGRLLQRLLHLDLLLAAGLLLVLALGFLVLYSASGGNPDMLYRQGVRAALGLTVMLVLARIPHPHLCQGAPWIYFLVVLFLLLVMFFGQVSNGAQRWLDLGLFRFQPSELMKLAMPMMLAWYFSERPLPPRPRELAVAGGILAVPVVLIARQPDLGTALLVAGSGLVVIFLAGIRWRILMGLLAAGVAMVPLLWQFMHDYQRQRVLTLLNPESDPLGAGYHIIQSKIAIGSGGVYGKGWLNGTQSQLEFLPERSTDFIFAVFAEEFGLFGVLVLLALYLLIILRGLVIAVRAQDTYARLLAGSLSCTFFIYVFVNMGMVSGLLPVVGVPLPLVSYGGTSMVTLMAAFGMLMSIQSHRRLLAR